MHKVFISYHHSNDQYYKDFLIAMNQINPIFIDGSVDSGDINDDLTDQEIRRIIRDEYLKDTTVTVLLVGKETKYRKHIDWEIYSSMFDGRLNKKSGLLVINLPSTNSSYFWAPHGEEEKTAIHPSTTSWTTLKTRKELDDRFPYVPKRILDSIHNKGAKISIVNWDTISNNWGALETLIDLTFKDKSECEYDFSEPMKRNNFNPVIA
ncbi:TIR domain-containing protein [Aeromonas veronii]|uniref:TIR domain-containing protein n=1 Tax=Aeromonas veronii TaxID=654 RepID=UPI00226CE833|nr:TIR domain-containing protein [Aeromonas veronii]MCX9111432.1 TIR domain-containing protein [Aeromonas veronii]